ncbi:MAG: hypothetical protein P4L76_06195, partial [Beijerinckiaceae bacterium]|nr:hypothetical protein [Beijerinckiaceae bacterium]
QQAPEVFSWRLYLDSMDQVLRRASRVVIDSSGKGVSGVVPYMPLGDPLPHGGRDIAQTPALAAPGSKP